MNSASNNSMIMDKLLDSAQGATSTNRQTSVVSGSMINVNNAENDIEGLNSYLGNSLTTLHWIHS